MASRSLIGSLSRRVAAALTRTTAFGGDPNNMIALAERVTDQLRGPTPICRGNVCGWLGQNAW